MLILSLSPGGPLLTDTHLQLRKLGQMLQLGAKYQQKLKRKMLSLNLHQRNLKSLSQLKDKNKLQVMTHSMDLIRLEMTKKRKKRQKLL